MPKRLQGLKVIGKAEREKLRRARMTKYRPDMPARAERLCGDLGCNIDQLASAFGVHQRLLMVWMKKYPELREAAQRGRDKFDTGTAEKCYMRRVTGYDVVEVTKELREVETYDFVTGEPVKILEMVPVKEVHKAIPPDVGAIKAWLACRQPERWREKQELEHSGNLSITVATGIDRAPNDN